MGRPITGSLRHHQNRWWASVPQPGGVGRRREEPFSSEVDARAWLTQAVAAARAGERLPDPDRSRTAKAARPKASPTKGPAVQPGAPAVRCRLGRAVLDGCRLRGPAPRRPRTRRAGEAHRRRLPRPVVRPPHHHRRRRHLLHGPRVAAPPGRTRPGRGERRPARPAAGPRPLPRRRGAGPRRGRPGRRGEPADRPAALASRSAPRRLPRPDRPGPRPRRHRPHQARSSGEHPAGCPRGM